MNDTNSGASVSSTGMPQESPEKKKKGLLVALCAVAVLLCVGLGCYFHFQSESDAEYLAYQVLENNDNPQDYRDYLEHYPDGEHAAEVKERLEKLEKMLAKWQSIALSSNVRDFEDFKKDFEDAHFAHLCDIKIDSLDFLSAQAAGTPEAFERYLNEHPDGRYASEASIAQGNLKEQEITPEDCEHVTGVISEFFQGFETQDEATICANITATMTTFLHQKQATKATVIATIKQMFNEHILGCQFTVNRDIEVSRSTAGNNSGGFTATFTVDQHIERDNEGKTFGSYRCVAELTPQLLISSLTMEELSRQ